MSKAYERGKDMAKLGREYDAKYPAQAEPLSQKIERVKVNLVGAPQGSQRGYLAELRKQQKKAR